MRTEQLKILTIGLLFVSIFQLSYVLLTFSNKLTFSTALFILLLVVFDKLYFSV